MVADRSDIRFQKVHYSDSREALVFAVDDGSAKHVACYGIDDILLFIFYFVDITGQHRDSADKFGIDFRSQKITVKVIRMKYRQLFKMPLLERFHIKLSYIL